MYNNRYFGKAAATLWNNFPVNIRKCKTLDAFKKKVKTNLFISAFLATLLTALEQSSKDYIVCYTKSSNYYIINSSILNNTSAQKTSDFFVFSHI